MPTLAEQLKNSLDEPTSTLASGIDSSVQTLDVATGHGSRFPSTGMFRIRIGTEIMIVGARSSDTLSSITRGAEGSTAASHSASDAIDLVLTAAALAQAVIEQGAALFYWANAR